MTELQWGDLQYTRSYGTSGGNVDGGDVLDGIYVVDNKPVYSGKREVPLNWSLPRGVKFTNQERLLQLLNTEQLRVFTARRLLKINDNGERTLSYYILDKMNNSWHTEEIKGDRHRLRAFGDWVVTEEASSGFKDDGDLNKLIQQNLDASANRTFGETVFEAYPPYLMKTKGLNVNQTGVMHLINVKKKIRLQIKTTNPDSEILLVKDGKVIYRVDDEIMQADISGNSIENTKLLIKGELCTITK